MTPKHTNAKRPALPISAVGRAFSFSFGQTHQDSADLAASGTYAVALEIHNMNALDLCELKRVHIMNFCVADQDRSRGIHIMNFNFEQAEPPSIRWNPTGAGETGAPSTYKGARNVMS